MAHEIRVLTSDAELDQAANIFYTALVAWPPPENNEARDFYEPGRCIGAFSGDEMVGTATSFTSWLTVPGGARIPHAAVTDVGVLPGHTRRGVARALLARQFEDAAARGETVATLRASEGVIYERFGYGVANQAASVSLHVRRGGLRASVSAAGPVRLVNPRGSSALLAGIYEPIDQVGSIGRPPKWWQAMEGHFTRQKDAQYLAVHGAPGAEDGFARYAPVHTDRWFEGKERTIVVQDFIARTEAAYLGLLRFLTGIDLIDQVELPTLPVDHALPQLMIDPRAARTTGIRDETWLRFIDVEAALAARTYGTAATGGAPRPVVIDVQDALLPANTGRYRVSPDGAARTDADADLSLDVAALATAYLGGTPWWQLARAGRATEHTAGALAAADQLFATPRAPFSGTMF